MHGYSSNESFQWILYLGILLLKINIINIQEEQNNTINTAFETFLYILIFSLSLCKTNKALLLAFFT